MCDLPGVSHELFSASPGWQVCDLSAVSHGIFSVYQVGRCVVCQIYIPCIVFCFTRSADVWFVRYVCPMYCFLFHQVGGRALASPLPGWSCFSSCPPWFSASSSCLQRMEKCHLYKAFWEWHLARSHSECERCPEINRQGHPSDPDLLWGFLLTETLQWKKVLFW